MAARAFGIVLAAGEGRRMGADKALLDLHGRTAIERVVDACENGGVAEIVVVRRAGAPSLPDAVRDRVRVVEVPGAEMIDSLRAGLAARTDDGAPVLVFPVDYAMVGHEAVATVLAQLRRDGARIGLPLHGERPGHPIALDASLLADVLDPAQASLRDVIRAHPDDVRAVPVSDPWVRHDLDTPEDLAAARSWLRGGPVTALMRAHRSRRGYRPDPLPEGLLDELVDAARYASTSSFVQAYAVVAVENAQRKAEVAALCADQRHIHEAPVFLAICADMHKIERACAGHDATLDARSMEVFVQATVDAALVGQNLQLAAESVGLGACMIGAARNHPEELAALLALPAHAYVVFGMTLGYPSDDPVPRGRMPLRGVLHRERYDPSVIDGVLDEADEAMRAWARRLNAETGGYIGRPVNETKGWADRMAKQASTGRRPNPRDALRQALRHRGFAAD